MSNSAKFTIDSPEGSHTVFLEQDGSVIHSVFDGAKHDMTKVSANSESTSAKGIIAIAFWNDPFTLLLDTEALTGTLMISGLNRTFSGVMTQAQMTAVQTFLKKCGLPRLSE